VPRGPRPLNEIVEARLGERRAPVVQLIDDMLILVEAHDIMPKGGHTRRGDGAEMPQTENRDAHVRTRPEWCSYSWTGP